MNRKYYEILQNKISDSCGSEKIVAVTYLDGERAGEKEIFSEEKLPDFQDKVFVEKLSQPPVCVLCGAGHVGIPVIQAANLAGFETVALEDRPGFADKARRAGASRVICDNFKEALEKIPGGQQVYFVVMTRGHRYDEDCLKEILKKPYAYVGMMSSRGRAARMKQTLEEQGFSEGAIAEIHMPIGLSIHAKTPGEIAISVLAEMIEVKNSLGDNVSWDRDILESIVNKENDEPWILATIIKRFGSAPREVGAKMLLTDMGTTIGSVGGGCMEAEVIREGIQFLRDFTGERDKRNPIRMVTADMSGAEAEEAGMVCGGRIEVLLEVVN